ncbi:MAG: peptide deformylase [Bacteroidia bacterium]|nr:peptide deformylase [Bacteroidia bacterium]MDW8235920.1 peptide deformylase [Bacteroidia bacterium]
MVRPIVLYGSPILRQKAQPVPLDDPRLPSLIQDLWDTMHQAQGVGLAAPQIGVSLQVFVVDTQEAESSDTPAFQEVFINPRILSTAPSCVPYEEGCLSIPGIRERVYRSPSIEVEYYDRNLQLKRNIFEGFPARVIQHEYDHLLGLLFIDYLSPLKRQLLRRRLQQISRGAVQTAYPIALP